MEGGRSICHRLVARQAAAAACGSTPGENRMPCTTDTATPASRSRVRRPMVRRPMGDVGSTRHGPGNAHPLSQLRTELVRDGKYDEYGSDARSRRPDWRCRCSGLGRTTKASAYRGQGGLSDESRSHLDDFRNYLVWGEQACHVLATLGFSRAGRGSGLSLSPQRPTHVEPRAPTDDACAALGRAEARAARAR